MKNYRLNTNIFDYDDHRSFLGDAYRELNGIDPAFSYRYLQGKAGYSKKSNHFWQIVKGRAPLSRRAARAFGRALGLDSGEIRYLVLLSELASAKNDEERNRYAKQIRRISESRSKKLQGRIHWKFYEQWYLPALREVVNLEGFREDPHWIAEHLVGPIKPLQVEKGLRRLIEMGFLSRDDNGRLCQSFPLIGNTDNRKDKDPLARLTMRNFHRQMIQRGADAIEKVPQSERMIVGITMSVSEKQQDEICRLTEDYVRQVEAIIAEDEPVDSIARLNIQLFPLTSTTDRKGRKRPRNDEGRSK